MKTALPPFLLAFLALGLGGCGLRGPLYLPDQKPASAGSGAQSEAAGAKPDGTVPQPAPQAQKRDRATAPAN